MYRGWQSFVLVLVAVGLAACNGDDGAPQQEDAGVEVDAMPPDAPSIVEICDNDFEDDGDGYIDCDDTDCALQPICAPESACGDGEDNDDDGLEDCADTDCAIAANCLPEGLCSNGSDDDLDGDLDCDDDDCALFCLAGCLDGESLMSISAIGLPQAIDTTDVVVDFPVNVPGWISGAAVHFTIDHTFPSDLDISLQAPSGGPTIDLTSDNPQSNTGEDYTDTFLGDGATASITTGGTPFTGSFRPEQPFSRVVGLPALGTWQVTVHDDFAGETGMVQSMELLVCTCNGTAGCETLLACLDNEDNDGDAIVDCDDPDCGAVAQCTAETVCDDGLDSNLNGLTDCQDPDCVGIDGCEQPESSCEDGFDNDGDLVVDCDDPDCFSTAYCSPEADCTDGSDDDGDGQADCLDVGCDGIDGCELGSETSCVDGFDNDGDTLTDCADADCAGLMSCSGTTCPVGTIATNRRATGLPAGIADLTTITSTIPLAHAGLVQMVAVRIDAMHTDDADLDMFLDAPGGTVELATDVSSGGDNYIGTIFVDSATTAITAGTAPFTGKFRPEGSLATLNGRPVVGDWTLRVTDDAAGDTGALIGYEVLVCQCDAASGNCEFGVACRNGTDDDGDALIDCAESSCATDPFCIPETVCNDGLDQDLDGLIDCADPSCAGINNCEPGHEVTCTDGFDNDRDTHIDCTDSDCATTAHCLPETDCANDVDDDGDGLADCLDVGCDGLQGCELGTELTCDDAIDNDGDALTDCADPSCTGALYCNLTCPVGQESTYLTATDLPQPIVSSATINSVIPIATTGVVQQVAVKMTATHTFDGDLDVFLDAPGGSVELTTDNGSTGDNYLDTVFTDTAATSITAGVAPFTGSFRPELPLSALGGTALAGDWKLRVTDDAAGDVGTLQAYEVLVCHCDPTAGSCEFGLSCRNGTDDDNDLLIDCADPNCATDPTCIPEAACNDNVDNDLDTLEDCLDPDCDGVSGCQLGTELACTDNFDNDADGAKDCFDVDCAGEPLCQVELICNNAIDDDGNGTIDCSDPACATDPWCMPETDCTDGADDDGDGATDCADVGCNGLQGCVLPPESGVACEDAIDNDGDHTADCNDPGCTLWCSTSCPIGTSKVAYRAGGMPRPITDNAPLAPVLAPIVTTIPGLVSQIAVQVDVTHTFDADLDIFLNTPAGQYELSTDNGSTGDNYVRTVFVEPAPGRIGSTGFTTAPFTGKFMPEQSITSLAGAPAAGSWELSVADDLGGDTGSLTNYELLVCQCDFASGACEFGAFACRNGADDDGNGMIDCADPGCAADPICVTPPPLREEVCNDGADDDGDGMIDCTDADCGWVCSALGSVCTGGKQLLRVGAVDLPQAIPATPPVIINSPFRVTRTGTIFRVAARFNATHLNDSDLGLFLTSPAGTTIELTSGNGGTGDNYVNTVFLDTAPGTIGTTGFNTAPFTGSFRPELALSLLSFESPTGEWNAQLRDSLTANGGSWTELSLGLCVFP